MTNRYSNKIKRVLMMSLTVLLGTTAMTASFATQALAQDRAEAKEDMEFLLEDIVVTGSRIVRRDFESVSPIVTVDETLFDHSATLAIETQLNKLPQFTPTMDVPTFGGDIQPTARNTPGEATVALRGLGSNRNLILINGRRATPSGGAMYVDVNTIPTAAIERVEAISGGASAVYGADALSGVVNFIMKEDFEGLEIDYQAGIDEAAWDGFEHQISGIMGASIADDRGNVNLAFSYNRREDSMRIDRDWYLDQYRNTQVGGFPTRQFFPPFAGFTAGMDPRTFAPNPPSIDAMNAVIDGANFTEPEFSQYINGLWIFNEGPGKDDAFTGYGFGYNPVAVEGSWGVDFLDGVEYMRAANGMLQYTNVHNYLILPMERFNLFTNGNFEISDRIGAFFQGYFSKVQTATVQEPGPITQGWAIYIDPTINRDMIPGEILTLLDSRPAPDAPYQLQALFPFDRTSLTEVYTYNLTGGIEGTLPLKDWTWELFVSTGEAETTNHMGGFASLQRTVAIMTAGPNFGQGAEIKGNMGPPNWGFGASTATCTSGLNPYDWDSVTDDCWNAVLADIKSKGVMFQTYWETNLQGAVVDLPAGELRAAVGAHIRRNEYYFNNDTLTTEGRSFIEQSLGLYPADNTKGTIRTKEVYAEALAPILSDLPGIKRLDLELGGRRSDYSETGVSYTYKTLADWRVNDWLRVRGGYNRAERAPNMAELYLAPEQLFAFGAMRGDPCAYGNMNPYSANPGEDLDGNGIIEGDEVVNPYWAQVVELCGRQMEATGFTDADDEYYGIDYRQVMAGTVPTNPGALGPGGGGGFPHTVGNPDIGPETADTWTVGIVFDSVFENPWIADLRIAIDYYSIEVEDAIGQQSIDLALQQCVDPLFNPTYDPNSPYCAGITRGQFGTVDNLLLSFFNNGWFSTSGIDLLVTWNMDAGPGRVGVTSRINWLLEKKSTEVFGVNPIFDYVGTSGPNENGLNGNSYEWRAMTEFSYNYQDLRLALRWQLTDGMDPGAAATVGTDMTGLNVYHLFDLLGSYNLTENMWLRFGVENVLDQEPPIWMVDTDVPENGLAGGSIGGGIYDVRGRRYYVGARISFD